ncbi:membrane bound O-acyl transferase family-domain-containing protein [Pisolithus orientalis]|uniref:membrane bound O-acyl transferase family-domain-containing protein n=1 Tax=Pisolithus orientalis TaxID=936130 RepID=UPI0022248D3F|nr:membrane bound O-acyl transferase family-domain-containing protein [Pisolithus orientalis]KAI5997687.1 membrane bound O-acyl transferase family-domain-containing protein [Pisolithus orientalis]
MSWTSLLTLPTDIFRVPPVSERLPFDGYTLLAYTLPPCLAYLVVALLVILPGTRMLRIALWPLIALLAFRAAVYVDFTGGNPQRTVLNLDFALLMFSFVIRMLEWTLQKDPLKRHLRPSGSSPSIFMDALDLSTNLRGVGWNWSKSLRFPPDKRPTSRLWFIIYILLSAWFHRFVCGVIHLAVQAFSPETFTVLSGGTIFDATLPLLIRYIRSSILSVLVAFAIYAVMQMNYDIGTFFGVTVLQQDPAQWPPVFDKPWKADSLRDFWGYRWHQLFRRTFIVVGGWPLGSLFGHMGYVVGTFLGSGIYHNIVVVMINQNVEWWCMILSFGMMGVGIIFEHVFTRMTGRQVGGLMGRVWTMAWLLVWGSVMVDGFARAGMFASASVFETAVPAKGIVDYYVTGFDGWLKACAS